MSRWRDQIGDEGAEWLLTKTTEAGRSSGAVKEDSLAEVSIDTTAMEMNIAFPTTRGSMRKHGQRSLALAKEAGIAIRKTYARKSSRLALQVGRYAHARQFKRIRKALKTLKGYTARVMRDMRRQIDLIPPGAFPGTVLDAVALVSRLLHQPATGSGKIYALHEPDVDCVPKGRARVRYEFDTKVRIGTTIDAGFVVGMLAIPHDGHTLTEAWNRRKS